MSMERRSFVATLLAFFFAPFAAKARSTAMPLPKYDTLAATPKLSIVPDPETTYTIPDNFAMIIGGRAFFGPTTVITRKFPEDGTCPAGFHGAGSGPFLAIAKNVDMETCRSRGEAVPVSLWESSQNSSGVWFKLAKQAFVSAPESVFDYQNTVGLMHGLCERMESDFAKYSAILQDSMVDRLAISHQRYDCTPQPEVGSL